MHLLIEFLLRRRWLVLAATMRAPSYWVSRVLRLGEGVNPASLAAGLRALPGVADAVVVAEEGVAYLKVDSKLYDPRQAAALAGAPLEPAAG